MAAISGQRAGWGKCFICAPSARGVEWVETASAVFGFGHDSGMGSLLHDSLVSRVLWTSRAVVVAGVRA